MNVKVDVEPGICGFKTAVEARTEDARNVDFVIQTDCKNIRVLAARLGDQGPIDAYMEMNSAGESQLMNTVREVLRGCCAGCAVPVGIFKGMQVAAGLALPADVAIAITKQNP
ncbi:MAG: hypothetical protein M1457_07030 [bacterium]|nr:hypothetical protein [bacterium]